MRSFDYINAISAESTVKLLGPDYRFRPLAGGTDLLPKMKLRIIAPSRLINLKTIPGLNGIYFDKDRGLKLGALATLNSIAASDIVRERYPALFKAIAATASPQLRNRGTIGGNLNQDSRCWYFRGPFHCWLKGGDICFARDGNNDHHAIFGAGPCYTVHPSDPPVALIALGAEVELLNAQGQRKMPLEKYFQKPRPDARRLTVLQPAEIVTGIRIPAPAAGSAGTYLKAMDRQTWAFALVSVAAHLTRDGNTIRDASIVLGGVAPMPWRLPEVEAALRGQLLSESAINRAAETAIKGAQPLSQNAYKLLLIKGLLTQALESLNRGT